MTSVAIAVVTPVIDNISNIRLNKYRLCSRVYLHSLFTLLLTHLHKEGTGQFPTGFQNWLIGCGQI